MNQDPMFMPMMAFVIAQTTVECEKKLLALSDKEPNEATIFEESKLMADIETLSNLDSYLGNTSVDQFLELMKHFDKPTLDVLHVAFTNAHVTIGTIKHHLVESKELLLR